MAFIICFPFSSVLGQRLQSFQNLDLFQCKLMKSSISRFKLACLSKSENYTPFISEISIMNEGTENSMTFHWKWQLWDTNNAWNCQHDFLPGTLLFNVIFTWDGSAKWREYDVPFVQLGTEVWPILAFYSVKVHFFCCSEQRKGKVKGNLDISLCKPCIYRKIPLIWLTKGAKLSNILDYQMVPTLM